MLSSRLEKKVGHRQHRREELAVEKRLLPLLSYRKKEKVSHLKPFGGEKEGDMCVLTSPEKKKKNSYFHPGGKKLSWRSRENEKKIYLALPYQKEEGQGPFTRTG